MPTRNRVWCVRPLSLIVFFFCSVFIVQAEVPQSPNNPNVALNLRDFGAVGNGTADDGPALQSALNALAAAGGGTLIVPAGRYAIATPVSKDFTGLAQSVIIQGVESSTPVPPPTSSGMVLTRGLDLVSEFYPRTGPQQPALKIRGLQNFLIKDIAFVGTPDVTTDAFVTLYLDGIEDAIVRHCEFYALSSQAAEGAIVMSTASRLTIEQSVFLGCTANSGIYTSVVQNYYWKAITVSEAVFADYGQRPGFLGKTGLAAPFSWINVGDAAPPDNKYPRREVAIESVFLDEGAVVGLSSVPHRFQNPSAAIDLLYVTGLYMNVSNLDSSGHYLADLKGLLIESSHYGWSQIAESAVNIVNVENAILDRLECVDDANRIRADAATGKLTVINSIYEDLASAAQITNVINDPTNDAVEYVRQKFTELLGRTPDPAGHFYWSDQILQCNGDAQCETARRAGLTDYLESNPQSHFAVRGRVVDEDGEGKPGVTLTLGGSQSVSTQTDADGRYTFSNLPTSGVYTVTPALRHYTMTPAAFEIVTPAGDQVLESSASFNHHNIRGVVAAADGSTLAGVTVRLSGSQNATVVNGADGSYAFEDLPAGGNYVVQASRMSYAFTPATEILNDLDANHELNFEGTFVTYSIAGVLVNVNNQGLEGITVTLSGSESRTTTSDVNGNFSFTDVPADGNYTVMPSRIGFLFVPGLITYDSLASNQFGVYVGAFVTLTIGGRVTKDGLPLPEATVTLSGFRSGVATTDVNGEYHFTGLPRGADYSVTVAKGTHVFNPTSRTFNNLEATQNADFTVMKPTVEFASATLTTAEGAGVVEIVVTRTGDTTDETTIRYSVVDGTAQQGDDTNTVIGQLTFGAGESSQVIPILITDDAFVEGAEHLLVNLSNPDGAQLGSQSSLTMTISDNDAGETIHNPIDDARFFVRQHYSDFLNREPDEAGLDFWANQIIACGNNTDCLISRRQHVSAAFFLSIEFQETGFLIHRLYKSAYGRMPRRVEEFLFDARLIGENVVVGALDWNLILESNKVGFLTQFVERPEFLELYPLSLTPQQFVDALNVNTGSSLTQSEVAAAVAEFQGAADISDVIARQRTVRRVAENRKFSERETTTAFVQMQYFGYLQRNPNDAPDTNLDGFNFWLNKLNQFNGDYIGAEMVRAFIESIEYRTRFGR